MQHTRIAIVGASILYLVGCSGSPEPAGAELSLTDIESICDGSDDSRVIFAATAGFSSIFDEFTAAGGARYLVVDGHCDYALKENSLLGLRAGHLDGERAMRMAGELALLMLHIFQVDGARHEHGVWSPDALAAIENADRQLARLLGSRRTTLYETHPTVNMPT